MRIVLTFTAGLLLLAGAAYFLFRDNTYTLKFSEADIGARLDEKLPFSDDYFYIFNVTLENPRVDLVNGSDRIAGGMDAMLKVNLGAQTLPIDGSFDLSGGVRYEESEGAFYLNNPVIEKIRLRGLPDRFANRANSALSLGLTEFYAERPIYQFSEDDMKQATAKMVLRDVSVKNQMLHVKLGLPKSGGDAVGN